MHVHAHIRTYIHTHTHTFTVPSSDPVMTNWSPLIVAVQLFTMEVCSLKRRTRVAVSRSHTLPVLSVATENNRLYTTNGREGRDQAPLGCNTLTAVHVYSYV